MNLRRALATAALTLVAGGVLPMSRAYACSCVAEPGTRPDTITGTVFYGDVLRREVRGNDATYVVAVKRVYAGDVGPVAEVHTSASGASCGLEIPSSGPAVFFAQSKDGRLTSMLCGGTRTAADGPPTDLGEGRPPSATSTGPSAAPPPSGDTSPLPIAAGALAVIGAAVLVLPRRAARRTPTAEPGSDEA